MNSTEGSFTKFSYCKNFFPRIFFPLFSKFEIIFESIFTFFKFSTFFSKVNLKSEKSYQSGKYTRCNVSWGKKYTEERTSTGNKGKIILQLPIEDLEHL